MKGEKIKTIVVVGPQHPDTLPKSVYTTLKEMGYTVHAVDEREMLGISHRKDVERKGSVGLLRKLKIRAVEAAIKTFPSVEARVYGRVAAAVEQYAPDLVITHSAWIPPRAIARLKARTHATVVAWFPDHPGNLGRQYLLAAPYDFLFFKDRWLVDLARRVGRNAHYLPEACMPLWHTKVTLSPEEQARYGCDITTAGNVYYYRALIFETLMKRWSVKLWGSIPRWLDSPVRSVFQGRNVTELEKAKAFNGAKIVVNTFQGEVFGVNQRFFEIAGCGGFQICEHREAVSEFFKVGKEVITFKDLPDLMEKIEYYLANPKERSEIAAAAYARAHSEHTFEKRLAAMMEVIARQ